jgi:hypothetical protein
VRLNRTTSVLALVLALIGTSAGSAAIATAQTAVTSDDIQRLQDTIYDASRDVEQARARNAALAAELQDELDEARDEAVYLRVKLRKNEPIARNEYTSLRDRIEEIRARARGEDGVRPASPSGSVSEQSNRSRDTAGSESDADVPVGTELDVRLQTALSSKTAQVEDRFEATTMVDLREGDRVLIPAGSVLRGVVSSVNKAGRIDRQGKLTLAFDRLTVNGRNYPLRGTVTEALESEGIRGEAGRIGAGAGIGAIIGGILGGVKGALTGILIGAGGTIAATEGSDVELPAGTVLRVRLDTPLDLR